MSLSYRFVAALLALSMFLQPAAALTALAAPPYIYVQTTEPRLHVRRVRRH